MKKPPGSNLICTMEGILSKTKVFGRTTILCLTNIKIMHFMKTGPLSQSLYLINLGRKWKKSCSNTILAMSSLSYASQKLDAMRVKIIYSNIVKYDLIFYMHKCVTCFFKGFHIFQITQRQEFILTLNTIVLLRWEKGDFQIFCYK